MKNCIKKVLSKKWLGVLALALVLLLNNNSVVKAETSVDDSKWNIENADIVEESNDVDWSAIMSALTNQTLTDGSSIVVDNKYEIYCEDIIEPIVADQSTDTLLSSEKSWASSTDALPAILASEYVTTSYSATRNLYVNYWGTNTNVATVTHSITVYQYDTDSNGTVDKIHIYYGSLSATSNHYNFVTSVYDYNIVNTDGSFSMAIGVVDIYDKFNMGSYLYGASVSVTPGSYPSFTFEEL